MSENKFTPGPWWYTSQPSLSYGWYIQTVDKSHTNTFIGEAGGGLQSNAEIEANAKLIAAAPELLEALKDMVSDHNRLTYATVEFARAAIKKATE